MQQPPPSRRRRPRLAAFPWVSPLPAALAIALSAIVFGTGASCGGGESRSAQPSGEVGGSEAAARVESLQQVDLAELTRVERRVWVELINDQLSPCGEPISVGRCASSGNRCRRCIPAARYLARLIRNGYERSQIEELYELRYGRHSEVEIQLAGAFRRGSPTAPVTVVAFSDFECPYCGRAHPVVQQLLEEHRADVQLIFKHFPLSGHPHSVPAARATVAAANQGKFWEMHDLLFEHQTQLEDEDIERYAEQIGLNLPRFRQDLRAAATQERVERDKAEGRRLEVDSTPTFFVNGRRFREPLTSLPAYVEESLAE